MNSAYGQSPGVNKTAVTKTVSFIKKENEKNSFRSAACLSGTYTVGVGQVYTTLTAAISAYNTCLSGPVIFELTDASYPSEIFPIIINANGNANAANTLTIKPASGVSTTISGSSTSSIIKLNGADYIIIDGSNNGTTTRNLTFGNLNNSPSSAVLWVCSAAASDGATNNTIKNCVVTGQASTSTLAAIVSSSGTTIGGTAEAANSNNTYRNNAPSTAQYGIEVIGPAGNESGTVISDNTIGSAVAASKISFRGIHLMQQQNISVIGNTITGVSSVNSSSTNNPSGGIDAGGTISGGSIDKNIITDIKNTSSSGWASYGIILQSTSSAANLIISNNLIYDVTGKGWAFGWRDNGHGIGIISGGGYNIYFNSISLNTNQTISANTAALYIASGVTSLNIRNNIFSNTETTGTRYAVYDEGTNAAFTTINYNDYYAPGGSVGFLTGARTSFANWQSATAQDASSYNVDPLFTSTANLHLQNCSPMDALATPIAGIATDFDAAPRNASTPDIGADEITPAACSGAAGGTASITGNISFCSSASVTITDVGYSCGAGSTYQWQYSSDNFSSDINDLTGQTLPFTMNSGTITSTTSYRLKVTCNSGTPANSNQVTITVNNPSITSTTPATRCGTGTLTLNAAASGATTYNWYDAATGGNLLKSSAASSFTTPNLSSTTDFWISASSGATATGGKVSTNGLDGVNNAADAGLVFTATSAFTIASVNVYPQGAGTITIQALTNSGALIPGCSISYTFTGASTIAVNIPLGFSIPVGTNHRLIISSNASAVNLFRDFASSVTFPYSLGSVGSITGGWNVSASPNYYFFYNWTIINGCESGRTKVTATITSPAPVTATASPSSICTGSTVALNVSSSNGGYSYNWSPGNLNGASQTITPAVTTLYTVTATDISGCSITAMVPVTVNILPVAPIVTPTSASFCQGGIQTLTVTGASVLTGTSIASSGNINLTIPDANPAGINNSISITNIPAASNIDSVIVTLNISMNLFDPDIIVNLEAPNGQIINLISGEFITSGTNFTNTSISSDNTKPAVNSVSAPFTGTFKADAASSFEIASVATSTNLFSNLFTIPDGNWKLRVYDDEASGVGVLNSWSIKIAYKQNINYIWSPSFGIYTDMAATVDYMAGDPVSPVYAKPPPGINVYTASATSGSGCTSSSTTTITVKSSGTWLGVNSDWNNASNWCGGVPTATTVVTIPGGLSFYPLTSSSANIAASSVTIAAGAQLTIPSGITLTTNSVTNNGGFTMSGSGNLTINFGGTFTNNGTYITTGSTGSVTYTSGGTASGTINFMNLTIGNGGFDFGTASTINGILTINNGAFAFNCTHPAYAAGSTLKYNTAGTFSRYCEWNTSGGAGYPYHVQISNNTTLAPGGSSNTGTTLNMAGDLTIDAGSSFSMDESGNNMTVPLTVNGNILLNGNLSESQDAGTTGNIIVKGNWTNNGTFLTHAHIVFFSGTAAESIGGSNATTFDNLTINNTSADVSMNKNVSVNNILTLQTGSNLSVNGNTLTLGGTITGAGNLKGSITSNLYIGGTSGNSGTINFASGAQTLNLFTLNRTGVGQSAAALLGTNLTIKSLTLTNGILGTNHKLLTYDRTGTYTPPALYTNSYICTCDAAAVTDATDGSQGFKINNIGATNTDVFFPVSSDYKSPNRMMINNQNGTANDFTVAVGKGDIGNTPNPVVERIWYIKATNPGSGAKATMKLFFTKRDVTGYPFLEDEVESPFNYGDIHLAQQNALNVFVNISSGSDTKNFIASANGTEIYGQYTYGVSPNNLGAVQGITTFNRFAVINSADYILPVNIISFKAWQQGTAVQLAWTALNEIDIDHYEVERSADARGFIILGNVAAKNTGSSADYNFADQKPNTGNNYYRIKVLDKNGAIYYTQIINVVISANGGASIAIYPNPVSNGRFTLQMTNMSAAKYNLLIHDAKGRLVFSKAIEHTDGSASQLIELPAGTAAGVYEVNLVSKDYSFRKKIVVTGN